MDMIIQHIYIPNQKSICNIYSQPTYPTTSIQWFHPYIHIQVASFTLFILQNQNKKEAQGEEQTPSTQASSSKANLQIGKEESQKKKKKIFLCSFFLSSPLLYLLLLLTKVGKNAILLLSQVKMLSVGHFRAKLGKQVTLELSKVIMSFSRKIS